MAVMLARFQKETPTGVYKGEYVKTHFRYWVARQVADNESRTGNGLMSPRAVARQTKRRFTPRQVLFIREYLVDSNATEAAKRAGYAPGAAYAQGYRLLKNVQVAEDIQRAVNALGEAPRRHGRPAGPGTDAHCHGRHPGRGEGRGNGDVIRIRAAACNLDASGPPSPWHSAWPVS